ncbi:MAG: hypothetical protein WCC87_25275 [Candidatus Korobacteraceae bacterium]
MKKVTLLAAIVLTLAMCASAQQFVDFTQLPATGSPTAIPLGYGGLSWDAVEFVAAPLYDDANLYIGAGTGINSGRGFFTGNEAMVAFGGGPMCYKKYSTVAGAVADGKVDKHICESSISAWNTSVFEVDTMEVSDGWDASGDFITLTAYNNGVKVNPQVQYKLSTTAQKLDLKANNWGPITELVIHPSPAGSFVIYTMQLK